MTIGEECAFPRCPCPDVCKVRECEKACERYNGNEDAYRYSMIGKGNALVDAAARGWEVPNRLAGAWINSEGDAV